MSTQSNDQGRAYEFAWINALYAALSQRRRTRIVANSSLDANRRAWEMMDNRMRHVFEVSAGAAINSLLELEPLMIESDGNDELTLQFQNDIAGTQGDVRDVLIKRDAIRWEIGLSIKHNHEAIKHSRLSHRIDFGREWYNIPCGEEYWTRVNPIFSFLMTEKERGTNWSSIPGKSDIVYVPLLEAFISEVRRAYSLDHGLPQKMVEYLIGNEDYYKIISHDREFMTAIKTFNLHGTLNQAGHINISSICVPTVALPDELIELRFKTASTNTVEMYLNNGWQLSFRIHNASTKVEPSLKFDVQFIGMPVSILTIECRWREYPV